MKRIPFFIMFIAILVITVSSYKKVDQPKNNSEPIARWTGHVTSEEITTISAPGWVGNTKRTGQADFINALPTMYREEDDTSDLSDNKGTGNHTYHAESTMNGVSCVTDCEGAGHSELHSVVINEEENTYDIEAEFPVCKGTTCAADGGTREYGPEGFGIIVSNHRLLDKDMLSGTQTTTGELPGGYGTFTKTITWHLERVKEPLDVELIVKPEGSPKGYEDWVPEPGLNELNKGKVMNISLELRGKNGKPLKVKAESFELHLSNTSREPGITINYPVEPDKKQLPDLRFLMHPGIESIDEDQSITVGSPDGKTGKALIASYDGGGWATLTVEAILKDKRHIKGQLFKSGGEEEILIPKRNSGKKIALAWSKANKDPDDMDDEEEVKDNSHNGDGLTAYEEYRGVIAGGKYTRLDPNKKEVGILATKTDFSLFNQGIGWFKNASNLEPVRFDFDRNEIAQDGRLNKNGKTNHDFDQYAIYVLNGGLESALGMTYPRRAPLIPANINSIVIDWNRIQSAYQGLINDAKPEILKFTLQEYLAQTVAHELGHAVNVDHHGDDIRGDNYDATLKKYVSYTVNEISDKIRIFDRHGNLITERPYTLFNIGGTAGTVESGNLSCMLNYYPYYSWGFTKGADGAYIYSREPLIHLGKSFCKSKNGTDFNATQLYFGDAASGNCFGQIQLKD